jgi:hypothetical protein
MLLATDDKVIQALGINRLHPPFGIGIHVRCFNATHNLDTIFLEPPPKVVSDA